MPSLSGKRVLERADRSAATAGYNYAPGIVRNGNWLSRLIWGDSWASPAASGGVDVEDQNFFLGKPDLGICAGITMAWIISALKDPSGDATNIGKFNSKFMEVLRFQGAYFQRVAYNISPFYFEAFFGVVEKFIKSGVEYMETTETRNLNPSILPAEPKWAAAVSFRCHAIGAAFINGEYMIMDPNLGLYVYDGSNLNNFIDDLGELYFLYATNYGKGRRMELTFFK